MSTANEVEGIQSAAVTAWLAERTEVAPPLRFEVITGGHSNLTYRVTDTQGRRWVLRRPPLNSVLKTAHDMGREHRIIAALAESQVPVPKVVGLCSDDAVNGAPFYVMAFVDGLVARDATLAERLAPPVRQTVSMNLIDVLARLHAVDPEKVGLGDLGKREDYVGRQLRRWSRQLDGLAEASSARDLTPLRRAHAVLADRIPAQSGAGIVHGDYRLDNCIVQEDGTVAAVLDWELCTLGDVRADLGMLMVYWGEPGDDVVALDSPPTTAPGFATRRELVDRYKEVSGDDLPDLDYFVAFSLWRIACILEGVYARYLSGAKGSAIPADVGRFADASDRLGARAEEILAGRPALDA